MITEKQAARVLEVVDAGLSGGLGKPVPGQMCVEAAVCYAFGEPHGDKPSCVDPVLRTFKIKLNDSDWSSNEARANGMRRLAIAQLGTRGTLDQKLFVSKLSEMIIRKVLPIALRSVGLEVEAVRCENEGSQEAADVAAAYAAYAAARAADAARAAANAAAYAAARAAYAAADAAADADADAARAAARAVDKDSILSLAAEEVVKILIELKTPGSQFLYLTEK